VSDAVGGGTRRPRTVPLVGLALAIAAVAAGALAWRARSTADGVSSSETPSAARSSVSASSPASAAAAPAGSSPSAAPAGSSPSSAAAPSAFEDGAASIDALGRAFVAALAANDRAALQKLTPSYREYAHLLYPEFVKAGEPLLGSMGLQWAWDNLGHASTKDLKRLLDELGGKKLGFVSIAAAPEQPRGAVALLPKVVVRATDAAGAPMEIRGIFAIVRRGDAYKILRFRPNRE
jgi:hypothetical protein